MSKKKAHNFIFRVGQGMAGWASFVQAAKRSPLYSESLVYLPIFQLATSRGWNTLPQKKLSKESHGRGRHRSVDFVFRSPDEKIGVLLEVKFDRYNTAHCLGVTKDIYKLTGLSGTDVWKVTPPEIYRFVMIIGRKQKILARAASHSQSFEKLTIQNLKSYEDERLVPMSRRMLKKAERRCSP